jgi:hypothetical protein
MCHTSLKVKAKPVSNVPGGDFLDPAIIRCAGSTKGKLWSEAFADLLADGGKEMHRGYAILGR